MRCKGLIAIMLQMQKKHSPSLKSNIIVLLLTVLGVLLFLEFSLIKFYDVNFYSEAGYTIDAETYYQKFPEVRVHIPSSVPGLSYELNKNISVIWEGANI